MSRHEYESHVTHESTFSVTQQDWSLHRKGPIDETRHKEKVQEAIKDNLPSIIADESIITATGDKVIKVPIRSLQLPRFRFDFGKNEHIGQGDGSSKSGDSLGKTRPGKGNRAGDQPGIDYTEAEITLDELAELIFADLGLPNMQPKKAERASVDTYRFSEISKKGLMSNLDKRRTVFQNIKRNAISGVKPRVGVFRDDDLRFRIWAPDQRPQANAVVLAMRDVSGSMGEFEKYITRSCYFWMVRFLRTKYPNVEIVFITHHMLAQEVDEEVFFKQGESGGTLVSSAYDLAHKIINQRYDPKDWNIYPFHFTDGDNMGDIDNRLCLKMVKELLTKANIFGYGEIREDGKGSPSALWNTLHQLQHKQLIQAMITNKSDVFGALQKFFTQETNREGFHARV